MNDQLKTDELLIKEMRKGGRFRLSALEQIFKNQAKRAIVIKYLHSKGCSKHDAEDLYQDAIIIFDRKVTNHDYLSINSIDSYIFNITKLNWYNKYRHNKRWDLNEIDDRDGVEEDVSKYYERQEQAEVLQRILNKFGERCKKLLLMFSQSYELTEIATNLDMVDAERVRKEKYRCLNRMRKSVQNDVEFANYLKSNLTPDSNEF